MFVGSKLFVLGPIRCDYCPTASTGPPVPVKSQKLKCFLTPADPHSSRGPAVSPLEGVQCPDSETITGQKKLRPRPADLLIKWQNITREHDPECPPSICGYVERLKEGERGKGDCREQMVDGQRPLDRSSYHHAIAALENTSEEEEDNTGREEEEDNLRGKEKFVFQRPVVETESVFRPSDFGSRLLPPENKPLEMVVLKRAKELLLSHNPQSIAQHLLMADCQVHEHTHTSAALQGAFIFIKAFPTTQQTYWLKHWVIKYNRKTEQPPVKLLLPFRLPGSSV